MMLKRIKCLILCLIFVGIQSVPVGALSANDTVTSFGTGFANVLFSNGYHGFCLDRDKDGVYPDDTFITAGNTTVATSNVDNSDISQALKVLFTQCFNDIFVSDGSGSYVLNDTNLIQAVVWHFTEGQYVWGDQLKLVNKIKSYTGEVIPDNGYQLVLDNGDIIIFYFLVMQPEQESIQDFFGYRITVTSGEVHQHNYGEKWESDNTSHWHECECGDKKDVTPHSGGTADCKNPAECETCGKPYGGTNDENHTGNTEIRNQAQATEDAPGYTGDTYCKDCGDLLEEGTEIPQLHQHNYGEKWESDNTSHWHECECGDKKDVTLHSGGTADCKKPAECETCGKPYGGTNDENHTGNTEIRNQAQATEDAPGYTGDTYCKDCGDLLEEGTGIPQLHQHNYGEKWESDNTSHWHECECGDKKDVTPHSGGAADCKNPAECETCGKPYGGTDDENHTGNTEIRNQAQATEDAPGYTGDTYCKDCGDLLEEGTEIPQLHQHNYGEKWESDNTSHWHECECGDKKDVTPHSGGTADCKNPAECETCGKPYGGTNDENHTGNTETRNQLQATEDAPGYTGDTYCKDCGDLLEEGTEIPQLQRPASTKPSASSKPSAHRHDYTIEWKSDDASHWRECRCGSKQDVTPHSGGAADCKNPAECETCGKPYGGTNGENHTGNTEIRNQLQATEDAPGYTGDTYCKDCGDLLEKGKEPSNSVVSTESIDPAISAESIGSVVPAEPIDPDDNGDRDVKEADIPHSYTPSNSTQGDVVTITNTDALIQTGKLNWPIPVLGGLGALMILCGIVIMCRKRENENA